MKKKILCLLIAILSVMPLLVSCRSGYKYDYKDLGKYITLPEYKNTVIDIERDYLQQVIDDEITSAATDVYCAQKGDNIYVDIRYRKVKIISGEDGEIDQYGDDIDALKKTDFLIENVGAGSYCMQIENIFVGEKANMKLGTEYTQRITLDNSFPVEEYRNTDVYVTYKFTAITARKGDVVQVTYTGYELDKDGNIKKDDNNKDVTFDSGTTKFYLGSHLAIDDFENNLIGAKVGSEVEFFATFPEDYDTNEGDKSMNGKKVKFKATIKNVYTTPTYTDEFVKNRFGYETRKEFEESVIKDYATAHMIDKLVEGATVIKYPKKEYNKLVEEMDNFSYAWQAQYGYSYDLYLQWTQGITLQQYIDDTIRLELAYYAFAQKENLVPDEGRLNTAKEALITMYIDQYKKEDSSLSDEDARNKATKYVENNVGKAGIYDEAMFKMVEEHFENVYTINLKDATYTSVTTEKMPSMEGEKAE